MKNDPKNAQPTNSDERKGNVDVEPNRCNCPYLNPDCPVCQKKVIGTGDGEHTDFELVTEPIHSIGDEEYSEVKFATMVDCNPKLAVQVDFDGTTLWVNVDGKCALRAAGLGDIDVTFNHQRPGIPAGELRSFQQVASQVDAVRYLPERTGFNVAGCLTGRMSHKRPNSPLYSMLTPQLLDQLTDANLLELCKKGQVLVSDVGCAGGGCGDTDPELSAGLCPVCEARAVEAETERLAIDHSKTVSGKSYQRVLFHNALTELKLDPYSFECQMSVSDMLDYCESKQLLLVIRQPESFEWGRV